MGVEPPFIYDRPSAYTFGGPTDRAFNPKAATQASWLNYRVPKPQRNGPLIDFNKHPDSYLIVPYGNLNVEPMSPKTKDRVLRGRLFQLFLRVCTLLGALGLMFCVIAINKTSGAVSWIIRVAPAVVLCHSVYAIYHLCRSATGRTPASTASYMVFAGMVDTGLIPFFAFAAFMAQADYTSNAYGWSTLFNDTKTSYKVIYAFFLLSCTTGGLLVFSLFMDVYLAIMFRKIAKLPPDMNPLEPNLTSRPGGHKRNKSSMNVTEKHMSASTLATKRDSGIAGKRIPFIHTRTDSADSVTLYGTEAARNSRAELRKELDDSEKDPYRLSQNSSRVTLAPTRPTSAVPPPANSRTAGAGLDHRPARSSQLAQPNSRPSSWLSYLDYEGMPSTLSDAASDQLDSDVRPLSPVSAMSSQRASIDRTHNERENWYQGSARNSQAQLTTNSSTANVNGSLMAPPAYAQTKRSREPLGMNPPTPQGERFQDENHTPDSHVRAQVATYGNRSVLNDTDANSHGRPRDGSRPSSFIGSGGKSRFYGDLRTSMGSMGVSGAEQPKQGNLDVHEVDEYERTKTMQSASDYSGHIEVYDSDSDEEIDNRERGHAIVYEASNHWNGHRQVSNSTGYNLNGSYAGLGVDFGQGMGRRREVSGKIAEEGRSAGYGGSNGLDARNVGAMAGQAGRGGAAGWARFKGL